MIHKLYVRLIWSLYVRRHVQKVKDELFIEQLHEMNKEIPKRASDQ